MYQQGLVVDPDIFQHKLEKGGDAMFYLASLVGSRRGCISLDDTVMVGRASDNVDVRRLMDEKLLVSRIHSQVKVSDGRVYIRDLSSRNGTFVNGAEVPVGKWVRLYPDDVISLGSATPTEGAFAYKLLKS